MQSEQVNELFSALSKAQAEMTNGKATKQNPYLKNVYASIEDIWNEIRDPFAKNGLTVTQLQQTIDGKSFVITVLGHSSGQWIKSSTPLLVSANAKNPMQELGSAITYARRYGLSSISGFSVSDSTDDDGSACKSNNISISQKIHIEELLEKYPEVSPQVMQAVNHNLSTMTIPYYNSVISHINKLGVANNG